MLRWGLTFMSPSFDVFVKGADRASETLTVGSALRPLGVESSEISVDKLDPFREPVSNVDPLVFGLGWLELEGWP